MVYKLSGHVNHEQLLNYGFTYRGHYDNYIFIINQPKTQIVFNELINKYNYSREEALKQTNLKRTYLTYAISVNLKTKKINMWTHALNNFPYEDTLHQHDIPEEFIELLYDLRCRQIIIKEVIK